MSKKILHFFKCCKSCICALWIFSKNAVETLSVTRFLFPPVTCCPLFWITKTISYVLTGWNIICHSIQLDPSAHSASLETLQQIPLQWLVISTVRTSPIPLLKRPHRAVSAWPRSMKIIDSSNTMSSTRLPKHLAT